MIAVDHPEDRILVTIPISHFCEKARWALDRAGLAYTEQRHVQGLHRLATRRARGGQTAPVLATPDGVFADSRAILFYADALGPPEARLYPADAAARRDVVALEERFDTVVGVESRRWIYHQALAAPKTFTPYNLPGVPAWERRVYPLVLPAMSAFMKRYFDISDGTAARAKALLDGEFDTVARRLADGRRYLTGDRFTAADLAFAALAAPLVVPEQYGVPLPQPGGLPPGMQSAVAAFRAHPAGAFALRLFGEDRGRMGLVPPVAPVLA